MLLARFLGSWKARGCVDFVRIVIDEVQNALEGVPARCENTWRPLMRRLFDHPVQLIFMTATMPEYLRAEYRALIDRPDITILCEGSDRPNVAFHFIPASVELTTMARAEPKEYQYQDVVYALIVSLLSFMQQPDNAVGCILVFFVSPDMVQSFAEQHGYLWHTSNCTKVALQETLDAWGPQSPVLVGTTALAEGLDFNVRHVIVGNVVFGHTTITQMLGRAGRDGLPSDLFFVGHHGVDTHPPLVTGKPGHDAQHALNSTAGCQRKLSMQSMDGESLEGLEAYDCANPPSTISGAINPCGNCDPEGIHRLGRLAVGAATAAHVQAQQTSQASASAKLHRHTSGTSTNSGLFATSRAVSSASSIEYFSSQGPLSTAQQRALDDADAAAKEEQVSTSILNAHTYSFFPRRERGSRSGSSSQWAGSMRTSMNTT